jgi:hypothetical protein
MVDGRIPIKQVGGGFLASTDWKMANLSMPDKTQEYDYTLQDGVKQFIISSRNPATLNFAVAPTETSTNYRTIWKGCSLEITDVNFTGKTIYLKSDKDSTVVEILELF